MLSILYRAYRMRVFGESQKFVIPSVQKLGNPVDTPFILE